MSDEREEGEVRVTVCVPYMGGVDPMSYGNRMSNFFDLGKLQQGGYERKDNPRYKFFISVVGRLFTPVARDCAARHALETDSDYLYMIDDDMTCPDDMFQQLVKHDVDIVAPLAFTRNPPHKPVIYSCVEGYDHLSKKDYFINHSVLNYPRNQLVECDAVGFGAVLIKTWVLKALKEKFAGNEKWFMSTCGTGEDIYFCYQAKKIGARVWADTSCKIGHLGNPTEVTEDYVDQFHAMHDKDFMKKCGEYDKYKPIVFQGDKWR